MEMKDVVAQLLATFVALGIVAAAVFAGHDATTLVSPPESVAEEFTRKIAAGRYELAAKYLNDAGETSLADLRALGQGMHATGAIENVEGLPGAIEGDAASASAIVTTSQTELRYDFVLVRRHGVWKIAAARPGT
jgi:hypothetical protein